MTWWAGLPGLDWRYPVPPAVGDPVTALAAAARVVPPDTARGAYGSPATTSLADKFLQWLGEAPDNTAAYQRRLCLCLAASAPAGRPDQVLGAAKALCGYLARKDQR